MECCKGYSERFSEGLVLGCPRPCLLKDRNGGPATESKLAFSASLYALALVECLESSCRIDRLLARVSTESFGKGASNARRCPDSRVTSGSNVIDGLRLCRKSSRGERSEYRESGTEPLSGKYSEPSALEGGGTSMGGVDA